MKISNVEDALKAIYITNPHLTKDELSIFLKAAMWDTADSDDAYRVYEEHIAAGVVTPSSGGIKIPQNNVAAEGRPQAQEEVLPEVSPLQNMEQQNVQVYVTDSTPEEVASSIAQGESQFSSQSKAVSEPTPREREAGSAEGNGSFNDVGVPVPKVQNVITQMTMNNEQVKLDQNGNVCPPPQVILACPPEQLDRKVQERTDVWIRITVGVAALLFIYLMYYVFSHNRLG